METAWSRLGSWSQHKKFVHSQIHPDVAIPGAQCPNPSSKDWWGQFLTTLFALKGVSSEWKTLFCSINQPYRNSVLSHTINARAVVLFQTGEQRYPQGSTGRDKGEGNRNARVQVFDKIFEKGQWLLSATLPTISFSSLADQKAQANHVLLIMKKNGSLLTELPLHILRSSMSSSAQESNAWLNWTLASEILEQGLLWDFIQYNCVLFLLLLICFPWFW